jgi:hypothetical protein
MFKLVVALLLALTVGWKVALGLTDYSDDNFKPMLIEFLVRHHFAVSEAKDTDFMSTLKAVAGDCRLLVTRADAQGANRDIIQDFVSPGDDLFFVFRRAIYTSLPTRTTVTEQYWSRFLRKMGFEHPDTPILAVVASARCNAERLPWYEFLP